MRHHPRTDHRKKKERPGGCFVVARQKARIARRKAGGTGGSPSAAGIVSGILFEHGGLVAIMAVGQIMSALLSAALTTFVSLVVSFGRRAPTVFQTGGAPVRPSTMAASRTVAEAGEPVSGIRALLRPPHGGGSENAVAQAPVLPKPSVSPRPQDIAHRAARAAGLSMFGDERAFEVISQKLEYKLEAPITKYVPELQRLFDKKSPALASFLSMETNSSTSSEFKAARDIYKDFLRSHSNFSGVAAAHAVYNRVMEIAMAAEAARLDPTKGPGAPGLENDGEGEGGSVRLRKADDDYELSVPTPFGRKR